MISVDSIYNTFTNGFKTVAFTDGGPQCRMSILRNGNVACPCRLFYPMSNDEFKKRLCHMSLFLAPVACH